MSWVTVVWSAIAGAGLTLAAVHLLVWYSRRAAWASLCFSVMAMATAIMGFCELLMMHAQTPGQFAAALRWFHAPGFVVVVMLVAFVRTYLRAGRPWLGWTVCIARAVSLLLNFLVGQNLNYLEVVRLRHIPFLGESVSIGVGVPNPWMIVGQLSLLLLVVFVADAAITVWRRGDRRQALAVAGSILLYMVVATVQSSLIVLTAMDTPVMISPFFLGIAITMSGELGRDLLRSAKLADDLSASEERLRHAAEAAGFSTFHWDHDTGQATCSSELLALCGLPAVATPRLDADLISRVVHPDDQAAVLAGVRAAADPRGSGILDESFRIVRADGQMLWLHVRSRTVFAGSGRERRPLRSNGIVLDITERRLAQEKIEQQRSDLAHIARVATAGELTASLAHELSQPLSAIARNAEAGKLFLQDPSPDLDEVCAIFDDILKDDQRAGGVIDGVRALMRRREIERIPLDLGQLLDDVVALVRPDAVARGVLLARKIEPGLPPVRGDRAQLQQVVLNLVLNAMDALSDSPAPQRVVTLRARSAGSTVEVAVRDGGPGIPADKLTQIFESFVTSKPAGMGMGLAISRGIIEAHEGRLWVENNPEGGATFTFVLPAGEGGGTT